jgi:hypothetical protein
MQLTLLTGFLRATHPHDVLTPCGVGDKRPFYPYKPGWTWDDFHRAIASERAFDYAIILHDLCVVDCDSPEAAADLVITEECSWLDITDLGLDRFDAHGNSRLAPDPISLPFPESVAQQEKARINT